MGRTTPFIIFGLVQQLAMTPAVAEGHVSVSRVHYADSLGEDGADSGRRDTLMPAKLWLGDTPMRLSTDDGVDGSLYNALQLMPGAQVQGETAALVVRGGSSGEQLTFIDGMHVMCPYTSPTGSSLARNSYSTHIVDGFSLVPGGASMEFGNALSAVVAIDTKDRNDADKLGATLSTGGININGNKTFSNASLSADLNYQNHGLSGRIFPCRIDYAEPFTMYSAAAQLRLTPSRRTAMKAYAQYDRTTLALNTGANPARIMSLGDDNIYLNATLRHATTRGWQWFAGAALSCGSQLIKGAAAEGDQYRTRQSELHLKAKTLKALTESTIFAAGAECYLMKYGTRYKHTDTDYAASVSPTAGATFASLRQSIGGFTADAALRAEVTWPCRTARLMPRVALTYTINNISVTAQASRYTRRPENSQMLAEPALKPEECRYASIGAKFSHGGRALFIEAYLKRYSRLPLNTGVDSWGRTLMSSDGKGRSRGFDLFVSDKATVRGLELQAAYSFNISRRRWLELAEMTTPQYSTRHNATLLLKYTCWPLRSIIGLTERFSSGRPCAEPPESALFNRHVKPYNSVDVSWTYILSKKVVAYASVSNVLCRKNVFGTDASGPVRPAQDNTLYIGLIMSIK